MATPIVEKFFGCIPLQQGFYIIMFFLLWPVVMCDLTNLNALACWHDPPHMWTLWESVGWNIIGSFGIAAIISLQDRYYKPLRLFVVAMSVVMTIKLGMFFLRDYDATRNYEYNWGNLMWYDPWANSIRALFCYYFGVCLWSYATKLEDSLNDPKNYKKIEE